MKTRGCTLKESRHVDILVIQYLATRTARCYVGNETEYTLTRYWTAW